MLPFNEHIPRHSDRESDLAYLCNFQQPVITHLSLHHVTSELHWHAVVVRLDTSRKGNKRNPSHVTFYIKAFGCVNDQ